MTGLRPITLITGASSGIGLELARVFARNGHELVLVARRGERLQALAHELEDVSETKPLVLPLDLRHPGVTAAIADAMLEHGVEPQYVVNNAGFGLVGPADEVDRDTLLAMIDVNARVLTDLSLAFVDSLARHRGGVLNVASVAGFLPGPGSAVYYASKAYVVSFSEALYRELKPRGVRVTALCPGPVATEFAEVAGVRSGTAPEILAVSVEQVAQEGYRGLMAGRRIVMPGLANKLITLLMRFIPRGFLLNAVGSRQAKRRNQGSVIRHQV
ncbi:MAG TPA: SDR family oxidoreductase [Pseudolabrys sp.]|nr:SDR family oxidoreductase [Pseudolabrys sp.]